MKLLSWDDWLDKYIPYYEAERHRKMMSSDPPELVLILAPIDRAESNKWIPSHVIDQISNRLDYEAVSDNITTSVKSKVKPLHLERDTRQEWYWAFWNKDDALLFLIKHS